MASAGRSLAITVVVVALVILAGSITLNPTGSPKGEAPQTSTVPDTQHTTAAGAGGVASTTLATSTAPKNTTSTGEDAENESLITSPGQLIEVVASASGVNSSSPGGYYLLYVSGRILVFNASQVPGLVGRKLGTFCFFAYVNNTWEELPFTVYDGVLRDEREDYFLVPEYVSNKSRIAVKMPLLPPSRPGPGEDTIPEAPDAGYIVWLGVAPRSSPYLYPIVVAGDSQLIKEGCGLTAGRYNVNIHNRLDWIERYWIPWPFQWAETHGYRVYPPLILELVKPIPAKVEPLG